MTKNFEINNYFYPIDIINQWIIDFEEVSKITIKEGILNITWSDENDIDNIFNEFINYITWLINEL